MLHRCFDEETANHQLDFLWMELTNQCNLHCIHCYSNSSPWSSDNDLLSTVDHLDIIHQAAALGCRKIQFIGGEPTLNKGLTELIRASHRLDYSFIEIYSNLTHLPDHLVDTIVDNGVHIATSVYSHNAATHDTVTRNNGSHHRTMTNIERLLNAGVSVRVGVIAMKENENEIDATIDFLNRLGVDTCGVDRIRRFGRADAETMTPSPITELCGSCWRGSVCVSPDGNVSPCIMGKSLQIGSLMDRTLEEIVYSDRLKEVRETIYRDVWLPKLSSTEKVTQADCGPECRPNCVPSCNPACSPNCSPCFPHGRCNPTLFK